MFIQRFIITSKLISVCIKMDIGAEAPAIITAKGSARQIVIARNCKRLPALAAAYFSAEPIFPGMFSAFPCLASALLQLLLNLIPQITRNNCIMVIRDRNDRCILMVAFIWYSLVRKVALRPVFPLREIAHILFITKDFQNSGRCPELSV